MTAAGAQRGLAAAIIDYRQANAIGFRCRSGLLGCAGRHLLTLHGHEFVGDRARVERQAVNVSDAAQPHRQFRPDIELEQAQNRLAQAEEAGRVATEAGVGMLVLSHLIPAEEARKAIARPLPRPAPEAEPGMAPHAAMKGMPDVRR